MTKQKKKKDRDKGKTANDGKNPEEPGEELRRHLDKADPQLVAFEKVQEKRQMEEVLKKASTTHKQRVEDFSNRHLDTLSEHYDIPKVSWTK